MERQVCFGGEGVEDPAPTLTSLVSHGDVYVNLLVDFPRQIALYGIQDRYFAFFSQPSTHRSYETRHERLGQPRPRYALIITLSFKKLDKRYKTVNMLVLSITTITFWTKIQVKNDHRSKFSNLSNWKDEAWKNQGFNRQQNRTEESNHHSPRKGNNLSSILFKGRKWNYYQRAEDLYQ